MNTHVLLKPIETVSFTFIPVIIPITAVSPRMASTSGDMEVVMNSSLRLNLLESRHVFTVPNTRHEGSKFLKKCAQDVHKPNINYLIRRLYPLLLQLMTVTTTTIITMTMMMTIGKE